MKDDRAKRCADLRRRLAALAAREKKCSAYRRFSALAYQASDNLLLFISKLNKIENTYHKMDIHQMGKQIVVRRLTQLEVLLDNIAKALQEQRDKLNSCYAPSENCCGVRDVLLEELTNLTHFGRALWKRVHLAKVHTVSVHQENAHHG